MRPTVRADLMSPNRPPLMLLAGDASYGSHFTSFVKAFLRLGCDCEVLDISPWVPRPLSRTGLANRLRKGRNSLREEGMVNQRLVELSRALRPDVFFAFKATWLTPSALGDVKATIKVHLHPDDTSNPLELSQPYLDGQPLWDLHVTNRGCNVPELLSRGARDVLHVYFAYDRDWHRPVAGPGQKPYAVAFIGNRRADRAPLIASVAAEYGKRFLVCGTRWGRSRELARQATVRPAQYGVWLSSAVASSSVCLGLLNSANRDLHNNRTFEMPAAGGAMLAERTTEHMALLDEGTEALFFSSGDELFFHLASITQDADLCRRIATAGHRRITGGGHTFEHRAAVILDRIGVHPPSTACLASG